MKTLPEILEGFAAYVATNHVIATGQGYAKRRMENDKVQDMTIDSIAKELMGCLPERRPVALEYDHAEARGHNQALDKVRARLTAFIGKEKS